MSGKLKCPICEENRTPERWEQELYARYNLPPVSECYECAQKQRISFRNARSLYQRRCDASGDSIISMYSPDKPYRVYRNEAWYGDQWDAAQYGRAFDPQRPFFEQLADLQREVPRIALFNVKCDNSDYCNMVYGNRNCYLIFGGDFNQDTMFGTLCMRNRDCLDCDFSNENELCYQILNCNGCYDCRYSYFSNNCTGCAFIVDCTGCDNCLLCSGLIKRSYCIENRQYSRGEYEQRRRQILNGSRATEAAQWTHFQALTAGRKVKYAHIAAGDDCSGDFITHSRNCRECFDVVNGEDLYDVIYADSARDCYRSSLLGKNSECCYQTMSALNAKDVICSFAAIDSSDVMYSEYAFNSEHVFGCIGVKRKKYCILNLSYSPQEFESLRARIIEHMRNTGELGKFLPKSMSCFGYNESTAQEWFPMSEAQALSQGYRWSRFESPLRKSDGVILPDDIAAVSDEILSSILGCELCGKGFRIIAPELAFYRRNKIPAPSKCPNCRYQLRIGNRNQRRLWKRRCSSCSAEVQTTYTPDSSAELLCEPCYHRDLEA